MATRAKAAASVARTVRRERSVGRLLFSLDIPGAFGWRRVLPAVDGGTILSFGGCMRLAGLALL